MSSDPIMEEDPKWMRNASEDELRDFVKVLDANENHPRHEELKVAFDKECNRRAAGYFEAKNRGEWI